MRFANLNKLKRKLKRMPVVAKEEIRKALEGSADEIVALMKSVVPEDEGKLKRSIGWTWGTPPKGATALAKVVGEAGLSITIYAGDESTVVTNARGIEFQNAILQEYGTEKMPANPYFRPSVRLLRRRTLSRISRATNKAAKKVAAGA